MLKVQSDNRTVPLSFFKNIQDKLYSSFPYKDIEKMYCDFNNIFAKKDVGSFSADFNQYCMIIAGTISYIINEKWTMIPQRQIDLLQYDFFEKYNGYSFLKDNLDKYIDLKKTYLIHEEARLHILEFLKDKGTVL